MLNLIVNNTLKEFDSFKFPGGEVHIRLKEAIPEDASVVVESLPCNSDSLMRLMLLVNAVKNSNSSALVHLKLYYLPYARQDRVCTEGDAFSLQVITSMINTMGCTSITLYDTHSEVTKQMLPAAVEVPQANCVFQVPSMMQTIYDAKNPIVVAPDTGAAEKSTLLAKHFNIPMYQGRKYRDAVTGKLTGFGVNASVDNIRNKDVFIFDDICDGGGTFLGLAEEIRKFNPNSLHLYVTHGIFSNPENTLKLHDAFNSIHTFTDWNQL